jgi:hypothetical protein
VFGWDGSAIVIQIARGEKLNFKWRTGFLLDVALRRRVSGN